MAFEERKLKNITLMGARIFQRNFRGLESEYNSEGDRNFKVMLPPELESRMIEEGWNVKYMPPRQDDPDQYAQPYLKVKVKFGQYPPIIQLINSKGRIRLDEETIGQLDWCIIDNVDLVIRPYCYPPSRLCPEGGVAAYMNAIYVTIREDDLESKYSDLPFLN